MKAHLLLLSAGLLLAGCATSNPSTSTSSAPAVPTYYPAPDSGTMAEPAGREPRPQWLSPYGVKASTKLSVDSTAKKGLFAFLGRKNSGKQKIKNSTIIYQVGESNTAGTVGKKSAPAAIGAQAAATDNTKAGQRGGAVALGPHSSATATTKKASAPFWLYAVLAAIIFCLGVWVGVNFFSKLSWLKRPALVAGMGVAFTLCFVGSPAKAQGPMQLSRPLTHYSYKQGKMTQRYLNYKRRQYQRQERRELAVLRRQHQEQQRYFNKHHRRKR